MAETIGPDGRKTFIASLERAQVKNNGDRAEYVRQLQAAARQGNPWARARYGHYKQEEMRAEFERGREAEQSSQGWNEAAYYTDTFGTCATLGANHSLQRMADKAMRGDTEGTLTELGTASLQVVTAAGAARRAVAVGKVAWARGVRLFRGGPASGTATTAVEAGGAAPAAPRPALQSVPRPPRSAARAEPPVPAPARSAPAPAPAVQTVPAPRPALSAAPPAPAPGPTTLHYTRPADPLTVRVSQYKPTGHDPGAEEWLQNMQRLRRAAGR